MSRVRLRASAVLGPVRCRGPEGAGSAGGRSPGPAPAAAVCRRARALTSYRCSTCVPRPPPCRGFPLEPRGAAEMGRSRVPQDSVVRVLRRHDGSFSLPYQQFSSATSPCPAPPKPAEPATVVPRAFHDAARQSSKGGGRGHGAQTAVRQRLPAAVPEVAGALPGPAGEAPEARTVDQRPHDVHHEGGR